MGMYANEPATRSFQPIDVNQSQSRSRELGRILAIRLEADY